MMKNEANKWSAADWLRFVALLIIPGVMFAWVGLFLLGWVGAVIANFCWLMFITIQTNRDFVGFIAILLNTAIVGFALFHETGLIVGLVVGIVLCGLILAFARNLPSNSPKDESKGT